MLDQTSPVMQRTRGRAFVRVGARGLRDLHQSGSAKAMLPRIHGPVPEVVFLNTAGGLTGGDRLSYELQIESGAHVVGTTQTAERAYASAGGAAQVGVALSVAAGARLDWLPQETILFEGSNLARQTRVDLAGDASVLMVETIILGRKAMGETIAALHLADRREVWRDGAPVLIEPLALGARALARRASGAVLGGARAVTTVALVAPGAQDALGPARQVLDGLDGVQAAASAWDGKLVIRAMAGDGWPLRRALAAILTQLRGADLPRVWQL
ncbi:urease accessory protein UreD [Aliiroseovarius sp. PTFE2010]|uniref:urease accessory protein UreD n=1 Tax=Aliiroseovarius sp. PTFE2010 TaxID=3417190 RepID=UPI003CF8505C